jgi:hypothetical protein
VLGRVTATRLTRWYVEQSTTLPVVDIPVIILTKNLCTAVLTTNHAQLVLDSGLDSATADTNEDLMVLTKNEARLVINPVQLVTASKSTRWDVMV